MQVWKKSWFSGVLIALIVGAFSGWVPGLPPGRGASAGQEEGARYADYARALKDYVSSEGLVDYKGLKANPGDLDRFVKSLDTTSRGDFDGWGVPEQIAFLVNAYNAFTLLVVIDHYPIQPTFPARLTYPDNSIRQIRGVWTSIRFDLMGSKVTLDHIENDMLRAHYDEPRIHMALVCASMGCPPLRDVPYLGSRLDEQLGDQSREFLSDPKKFRVDRAKERVELSPIFKWFGKDFEKRYGGLQKAGDFSASEHAVLGFIMQYVGASERAYLAKGRFSIVYLDYDWSLNEQTGP